MGQPAGLTMGKKKMGRPKSDRQDVSIKFDKILAGKARQVAISRGITLVEYLTELSRGQIDRDYGKVLRELEGAGENPPKK